MVSILLIRGKYGSITVASWIAIAIIIRFGVLIQNIGTRATRDPRIDTILQSLQKSVTKKWEE